MIGGCTNTAKPANTTTPTALLGHWRATSPAGGGNLYIAKGKWSATNINGNSYKGTYTVLSNTDNGKKLTIEADLNSGLSADISLTVSSDGKSLTAEMSGMNQKIKLKKVDDKQLP